MIRKIMMLGIVTVLVSALSLCVCFADGIEKLMPNIGYESERGGESIASKIKQRTGKDKVIVRVDKITKAPHSIIASGLEVSSQDKVNIKSAIDSFKSKRVDKKMRLKGEILSAPQQKIDQAARSFIKNNKDILSADESNLKLINIQKVRSKAYITYQQYYKGIPVYQAIVRVVISKEGKIPSLGSDYHKDIKVSTTPTISESQALDIAKDDAQFNSKEDKTSIDGLYILPLNNGSAYDYRLAYKLAVSKNNPEPACWVYFIDAHTGEILVKYNDIRHETLSGKVTGLMLPEYYDETPQRVNFRDEYVTIEGTSNKATTGLNGDYSFTLTPGVCAVSTSLEGPWAKVTNSAGASALYSKSVSVPSTQTIDWDTLSGEAAATQAEMSCFYHINKIHDYVKNILKYDNMDWQIPVSVNIVNYANAYFSHGATWSLGFGDGGSKYPNFALLSDIVYHEYIHAVTERIYTDGGVDLPYIGESGAIDEGLSDYFACAINDDSKMGEPASFARDLDNILKMPDNWDGEVHKDGRIIGGAFWDLRKNLITLCGEAHGKTLADDLIHNARFGYPVNFQDYADSLLVIDDDPLYGGDDDMSNGTPHSTSIYSAFIKHGIISLSSIFSGTFLKENEYIRGAIKVKTILHSSRFNKYELYIWKETTQDKKPETGSLIITAGNEGMDYLWDTSLFEDDIYCLGLKIITEDNDSLWVYAHNVTIDNYNNPCQFKSLSDIYTFVGEERKFPVSTKEIDDPNGPFGSIIVTIETHTLPSQPYISFDHSLKTWIFSWTPEESDEGKLYSATFKVTDEEYVATQTIKICVIKLVKLADVPVGYCQYAISGNYIVWTTWDIHLYDISKDETRQIVVAGGQYSPAISGNYFVWENYYGNRDIYLYDISKNTERLITSNLVGYFRPRPDISGDYIVWEDGRNGNSDIYLYDISRDEERQITSDLKDQCNPAISGDYIVWQDDRNGNSDIYLYDISRNEERQITFDLKGQYNPVISGNYITWQDDRNGNYDIYLYDISTDKELQITAGLSNQKYPAISGNYIVYYCDGNYNYDIYLYDISKGEERQITFDSEVQIHPTISGNCIVWKNYNKSGDSASIYLSILPDIPQDTTLPTTISSGIDGNWHTSPVTVTLTAVDEGSGVDKTYYSTDGAEPKTIYTAPFTLSNDGVYTIKYYSVDKAGNKEAVKTAANQVKIDTTPPTGTIKMNNGASHTTSRDVNLALSATDTGSGMERYSQIQISNDNQTWYTVKIINLESNFVYFTSPNIIYTLPLGDGTKTVYVKFKDAAGNWSKEAVSASIILDTPLNLLDIDGNGTADANTDGLLIMRYLLRLRGEPLIAGVLAPNATRTTSDKIEKFIQTYYGLYDIDANDQVKALSDGLLIMRYLQGARGDVLVKGVVSPKGKRKTAKDIEAYIESLIRFRIIVKKK